MRIIQKALIENNGKYLVLLRSPDAETWPDHWDLPGGKLEDNETPKEGIEREIQEETNLKAEIGKVIVEFIMHFPDMDRKFIIYKTNKFSGTVTLSHEHTDFRWASKQEILEMKIEPFLKKFFETNE